MNPTHEHELLPLITTCHVNGCKNVFTKSIASFIFVYIDLTIGFFLSSGKLDENKEHS